MRKTVSTRARRRRGAGAVGLRPQSPGPADPRPLWGGPSPTPTAPGPAPAPRRCSVTCTATALIRRTPLLPRTGCPSSGLGLCLHGVRGRREGFPGPTQTKVSAGTCLLVRLIWDAHSSCCVKPNMAVPSQLTFRCLFVSCCYIIPTPIFVLGEECPRVAAAGRCGKGSASSPGRQRVRVGTRLGPKERGLLCGPQGPGESSKGRTTARPVLPRSKVTNIFVGDAVCCSYGHELCWLSDQPGLGSVWF